MGIQSGKHTTPHKKLVFALSVLVVFCTAYSLILPAVTLSAHTANYCQKEEHEHQSECFQSTQPLCGQAESVQQPEECNGQLETGCDDETMLLADGHIHNLECFESDVPLCDQEAHLHTRQCQSDPEQTESQADWKDSLPDSLDENKNRAVLQVAKSQLGYRESQENFEVQADDSERGYTRYGDWAGDRYGIWNGAFAGWVLEQAGASAGFDQDLGVWIHQLQQENQLNASGEPGNTVFYKAELAELRVGIASNLVLPERPECIEVIEGDRNDEVSRFELEKENILGFLSFEKRQPGISQDNQNREGFNSSDLQNDRNTEASSDSAESLSRSSKSGLADDDKDVDPDFQDSTRPEQKTSRSDSDSSVQENASKDSSNPENLSDRALQSSDLQHHNSQADSTVSNTEKEDRDSGRRGQLAQRQLMGSLKQGERQTAKQDERHRLSNNNLNQDDKSRKEENLSGSATNSDTLQSSVVIKGAKNVEIGDEVVLESELSGIEVSDILLYQWQIRADEKDKWRNIEGANESRLLVVIDQDTIHASYRLIVQLQPHTRPDLAQPEIAEQRETAKAAGMSFSQTARIGPALPELPRVMKLERPKIYSLLLSPGQAAYGEKALNKKEKEKFFLKEIQPDLSGQIDSAGNKRHSSLSPYRLLSANRSAGRIKKQKTIWREEDLPKETDGSNDKPLGSSAEDDIEAGAEDDIESEDGQAQEMMSKGQSDSQESQSTQHDPQSDQLLSNIITFSEPVEADEKPVIQQGDLRIEIQKGWSNGSIARPDSNSVLVEIWKNRGNSSQPTETVVLNEDNNWSALYKLPENETIEDLKQYSVIEKPVHNWTPVYTELNTGYELQPVSSLGSRPDPIILTNKEMTRALARVGNNLQWIDIQDLDDPYTLAHYPENAIWQLETRWSADWMGDTVYSWTGRIFQSSNRIGEGAATTVQNYYLSADNFGLHLSRQQSSFFTYSPQTGLAVTSYYGQIRRTYYVNLDTFSLSLQPPGRLSYQILQAASSQAVRKVLITNVPNYGGSQITGSEEMIYGFPISKTIDYLGDGAENADTELSEAKDQEKLKNSYRISLSAGPIAGEVAESPVNVLFVTDTSASMGAGSHIADPRQWPVWYATRAIDEVTQAVLSINSENQVAVIGFDNYARLLVPWQRAPVFLNPQANGGTNYEAALQAADQMLKSLGEMDRKKPTFMIFLSDGLPTFTNGGGNGSTTDEHTRVNTINAIQRFKAKYPSVIISSIAYNTADNEYLEMLATSGRYSEANPGQIVADMKRLIVGPKIVSAQIIDTLSGYTDFDLDHLNLIVRARKKAAQEGSEAKAYTLLWQKNPDSPPDYRDMLPSRDENLAYSQIFEIDPASGLPYTISGKKITLNFKKGWHMDPAYEYSLAFNVKVTPYAYEQYVQEGYSDIGDSHTDYELTGNRTSSNQPGFPANDSEDPKDLSDATPSHPAKSAFVFDYADSADQYHPGKKRPYLKPVVQVHQQILLRKYAMMESGETSLEGAEFSLWKDHVRLFPDQDLMTDASGKLLLPLKEEGVYILKEEKAPEGFLTVQAAWTIRIFRDDQGKPQIAIEGEAGDLDGSADGIIMYDDPGINAHPSAVEYRLKIENKPGQELPQTGGNGSRLLYRSGLLLMITALVLAGLSKNRRWKTAERKEKRR